MERDLAQQLHRHSLAINASVSEHHAIDKNRHVRWMRDNAVEGHGAQRFEEIATIDLCIADRVEPLIEPGKVNRARTQVDSIRKIRAGLSGT
jgi:hypothetical protein